MVPIRGVGGASGLGGSLVVGRGCYKYFLPGYLLLVCNLMGLILISFSDILGILVRLRFAVCNLTGLVIISFSDILGTLVRLRFACM